MNILITGGRSDMAYEMVKRYSAIGHSCIVTASSDESVLDVTKLYLNIEPKVKVVRFLLERAEESQEVIQSLLEDSGIDVVILNAWNKVENLQLFHDCSNEEMETELDNIKGNLWLLKQILPHMKDKNFGRVLFISSIAAINGASRYGMYCLGKAAMEGIIYNLAVDYGEYNIFSNILRPGIIKTERTKRFWEKDFYIAKVSRPIPAMRMGEATQVAKATLPFIDKDSYISGTSINVSGGLPLIRSKGLLK